MSNKHSWTRPAPWPDSLGCFFLSPGYAARSGCSGNGCCERSEVKRQFSLAASKVHWVVTRGMCPALSRPGRNCFSVRVLQRWNAGWELLCPPYLSPWLSASLCFSCGPIFIYLFIFSRKRAFSALYIPLIKSRVSLPFVAILEVPVDCWMLNNVFPVWKSQLPGSSQDGSEDLEPW